MLLANANCGWHKAVWRNLTGSGWFYYPNPRTSTTDIAVEFIISSATWGWLMPSLTTCWRGLVLGFVGWTPTTGVPSCLQSACPSVSGKWHPVLLHNYAPYNIGVDPKSWLAAARWICCWSLIFWTNAKTWWRQNHLLAQKFAAISSCYGSIVAKRDFASRQWLCM